MTERPYLICHACRQPIPDESVAVEGYDGEPYHAGHQPLLRSDP